MAGFSPVLLLDEVVAHLDPSRRAALYAELERLGAQAWMTGADAATFADGAATAEMFEVSPGQVKRRTRSPRPALYLIMRGRARSIEGPCMRAAYYETHGTAH